jgi:hypothetical protein
MCWFDTAAQSFHLDSHGNFNGVVRSCMVRFPNCTVMHTKQQNSISGGHCKKNKNKNQEINSLKKITCK